MRTTTQGRISSKTKSIIGGSLQGRFPANLIHDGSPEVLAGFPNTKSGDINKNYKQDSRFDIGETNHGGNLDDSNCYGDNGSAARFFYCAKASKAERNRGCEDMNIPEYRWNNGGICQQIKGQKGNCHPTVKPLSLMKYLCTITKTPTGGIVLDPFCGSGTTLMACKGTGRDYIGIEKDKEYVEIARRRISAIPELLFK